jgi:hypothetical protein
LGYSHPTSLAVAIAKKYLSDSTTDPNFDTKGKK